MTLRRDAQQNRERLLEAAEQVFCIQGLQAPLHLVAEQAGVSRATQHRHFPDRDQLLYAIAQRRTADVEARLAAWHASNGSFLDLFLWLTDAADMIPGLHAALLPTETGQALLQENAQRLRAALARPLQVAQEQGEVRLDVTVADLEAAFLMLEGVRLVAPEKADVALTMRSRALILRSLFLPPVFKE